MSLPVKVKDVDLVKEIAVGSVYKHYKGDYYEILAVAQDAENEARWRVVYRNVQTRAVWDRRVSSFAVPMFVEGVEVVRFSLVSRPRIV